MPDARAEIESDSENITPASTYRTSGRVARIGPTTRTDPRYTRFSVICGDAREVLATWPTGCVDCVVTSPPYFGLRDYGLDPVVWDGDPLCLHTWGDLVPGDPRSGSGPGAKEADYAKLDGEEEGKTIYARQTTRGRHCIRCGAWSGSLGLEPTPDLYISHLVSVFDRVWDVMAESGTLWINISDTYAANRSYQVTDNKRVDVSNNGAMRVPDGCKPKDLIGIPWLLALALRARGWYLRSDIIWSKPNPMPESVKDRPTRSHEYLFLLTKSHRYYYDADAIAEPCISTDLKKFTDNGHDKQRGHCRRHSGFNGRYAARLAESGPPTIRNKRDVWTIATEPSPEPHFAMFPTAFVTPCVLAGCPPAGLVLDPFCGLGRALTTALTYSRRAIGIDLNPEYCSRARSRAYAEIRGLEEAL